ncbi:MAG: rod shape-determining protein MreD [Oscillospiraceae bacterium]|nr:rod shape-determining protein MreD [Oscillospiraceae bacterium]
MPKSYVAFKWAVYALATLFLFAVQSLVLNHIRVLGVTPFLYPILPAVAAMYEGSRKGPVFALVLGLVCDLLLYGPFEGFFTIAFVITALLASRIAENLLSPGFFSGLFISFGALLLTSGLRVFIQICTGGAHVRLMAWTALAESVLSLPAAVLVLPLYRAIHRRCAVDY